MYYCVAFSFLTLVDYLPRSVIQSFILPFNSSILLLMSKTKSLYNGQATHGHSVNSTKHERNKLLKSHFTKYKWQTETDVLITIDNFHTIIHTSALPRIFIMFIITNPKPDRSKLFRKQYYWKPVIHECPISRHLKPDINCVVS